MVTNTVSHMPKAALQQQKREKMENDIYESLRKEERKRKRRKIKYFLRRVTEDVVRLSLLAVPALLMLLPIVFLLSGSITSPQELNTSLANVWFPHYPTVEHFQKVLFYSPQFFTVFWNSVRMTVTILIGQLLVGMPAAWAFAVYRFRKQIFTLYIILMLTPFQVTMLSQYLVLNEMGLMDTQHAIILPAVFSTFPVFLMYRSFCGIPKALLEAGRIDGAGELELFVRIGIPLASGGICSCLVLGFLEYWNMIEQPLAFLRDKSLWPLSLYLPEIDETKAGFSFAASVITLIPAVFVFLLGQDHLEQGIVASGLKE